MALLLIVLLAVLVAFGFMLSKPLGQIMRMRRAPTLPIAALPNGVEAEVVGRAGGRVVDSPISDTPCVLWQVEVQEYRSSGRSGRWVTILKQTSGGPLEIDDDTGRVWALPAGAQLVLDDDLHAARGLFGNMTPQIEAALERIGVPIRGWLGFKRSLRVRERLIAPGEPIYALGLAEQAAGQMRLCSTAAAPLILADRSERAILRNLYWQLGVGIFCALVAVAFVGWFMAGGWP